MRGHWWQGNGSCGGIHTPTGNDKNNTLPNAGMRINISVQLKVTVGHCILDTGVLLLQYLDGAL